jgi:beta-lactamase class A
MNQFWHKKERWCWVVFTAMLLMIISIVTTKQSANEIKQYPLLNPAALINDDYDYVVRFAPLRNSLNEKYTNHDIFTISIYFEYLPTGANISVNKDLKMWPASLIKVPIAMAALKKVERGEWALTNQLVILDEDKDPSFGELYQQPSGTPISIEQLVHNTLVESDNTAHFVLLRNLEPREVEEVFVHLGLEEIIDDLQNHPEEQVVDNRLTTKNYSIFFRALFNATFLNPALSQFMLATMSETGTEYLGATIATSTPFSHKTGIRLEDHVWADSGVVYVERRPYLITVMIEQKNKTVPANTVAAEGVFEAISKESYEYVVGL